MANRVSSWQAQGQDGLSKKNVKCIVKTDLGRSWVHRVEEESQHLMTKGRRSKGDLLEKNRWISKRWQSSGGQSAIHRGNLTDSVCLLYGPGKQTLDNKPKFQEVMFPIKKKTKLAEKLLFECEMIRSIENSDSRQAPKSSLYVCSLG